MIRLNRIYACIDLKSFYASVECQERGLNPLTTNLVVADPDRTDKTICLAVSPALKKYGLPGRVRLYEVEQTINKVNRERKRLNNYKNFTNKSCDSIELENNKSLELDYIIAPPRMKFYIKYSTNIYNIYLKYLSKDDVYVYSIDEIFCDLTNYLKLYNTTPWNLVTKIIHDIYYTTGITATAGIGTNLYLAKVAMDIVAKHAEPDKNGVRIAELDELSYRKKLWNHKPLSDFWRVGKGYLKKLEEYNIRTMGDIAKLSYENEDFLYKLFGVNAEILIDHAWGYECCTIKDIKNYKPSTNSLSSAQVLHSAYDFNKAKLVVKEMMELLSLDLVEKHCVSDQIVLNIGYDISNLTNPKIKNLYHGEITLDSYGRKVPKPSHGTTRLDRKTSSTILMVKAVSELFDKIANPNLLIRKINISIGNVVDDSEVEEVKIIQQFDLFNNSTDIDNNNTILKEELEKEKSIQKTILDIKKKYGKNSLLKAMNLEDGATTIDRNGQIGGHKSD